MADEFRNYDSTDEYRFVGPRLTADPVVRETANGKMVRLQIVSTSRNKGKNDIEDLWVEVNVGDFNAEAASFMKKGDVLHEIKGKPYVRRFGESKEKFSFCLERATIVIPSELKKELKARGWDPMKKAGESGGARPSGKPSNTKRKPQREIQDLPED